MGGEEREVKGRQPPDTMKSFVQIALLIAAAAGAIYLVDRNSRREPPPSARDRLCAILEIEWEEARDSDDDKAEKAAFDKFQLCQEIPD
jgi:hypothetical protein